jgi:hypothetical protein
VSKHPELVLICTTELDINANATASPNANANANANANTKAIANANADANANANADANANANTNANANANANTNANASNSALLLSSQLLSNRAQALLQLGGRSAEAYLDATAGLVMDAKNLRGQYRRATALVDLGMEARAHETCDVALLLCSTVKDKQPFLQLLERIVSMEAGRIAEQKASDNGRDDENVFQSRAKKVDAEAEAAGERLLSDREMNASLRKDVLGLEQMRGFNQMVPPLSLLPKKKRQNFEALPGLDERIPPFHFEYAKEGMWPAGCNIRACERLLEMTYEVSRCVLI